MGMSCLVSKMWPWNRQQTDDRHVPTLETNANLAQISISIICKITQT